MLGNYLFTQSAQILNTLVNYKEFCCVKHLLVLGRKDLHCYLLQRQLKACQRIKKFNAMKQHCFAALYVVQVYTFVKIVFWLSTVS